MACDDTTEDGDGGAPTEEVERLFQELEARGVELLAPIEREIVAALRARPVRTWCRAPLTMLRCLHAKAHGRPWTPLLTGSKSE